MEKSKTKALCSHRMLDFLCFVLPPRCLSRIKARLARSQTISIHGNKAAVEQQCFSCNNAFLCARPGLDTPGWLAGAHTYSFRIYIYKKPIVAYPSLHSPLSSTLTNPQPSNPTLIFPPQPPIHPSIHSTSHPPNTPPPSKKKKKWAASPPAPSPLKTLTLTALHAAGPLLRGESARTSTSTTRRCGRRRCGERCGTGPWRRRSGSFGGSTMSG